MTAPEWSDAHPVGTEMLYFPIIDEIRCERVKVRSEAWALGHGAIVAKVTGRAGGVLVEHLVRLPPPPEETP